MSVLTELANKVAKEMGLGSGTMTITCAAPSSSTKRLYVSVSIEEC